MRLPWDRQFAEEVARYDLRYTCQDCVYYLEAEGGCAHEWPIADHLARHDPEAPAAEVVFCKELELR